MPTQQLLEYRSSFSVKRQVAKAQAQKLFHQTFEGADGRETQLNRFFIWIGRSWRTKRLPAGAGFQHNGSCNRKVSETVEIRTSELEVVEGGASVFRSEA